VKVSNETGVDHAALKKVKDDSVVANVKILENFYTFLIGFALTQATMKLADAWISNGLNETILGEVVLYISLLVTIVPFYQGMHRFLYVTHVVRPIEKPNSRSSPILLDVYAFLLMSCILFAMGRFLGDPTTFFYLWAALLCLDITWTITVWIIQKSRNPIWAWNNLFWLVLASLYWVIVHLCLQYPAAPMMTKLLPYGFVIFEVLRTVCDYIFNRDFYFPPEYRGTRIPSSLNRSEIIYLAGPYSNDAPRDPKGKASADKRLARFNAITEAARRFVEKDKIIYSPLTMTHPIDVRMKHDPGSAFWVSFDEAFMAHCSRLIVLKLPGWDASAGIIREIKFFRDRGIEPEWCEPSEIGITQGAPEFEKAFA
jgi:hypothetical protein